MDTCSEFTGGGGREYRQSVHFSSSGEMIGRRNVAALPFHQRRMAVVPFSWRRIGQLIVANRTFI